MNIPLVINIPKFWICQDAQYASVTQRLEYTLTEFWIYLEFSICQDSEYGRVLNEQELHRVLNMPWYIWICLSMTWICLIMSEFSIICRVLDMYHMIHSVRSPCKLMCTYWEMVYSEPGQRSKMERFGKTIIVLNYFCKTKSIFNLWEGSESVPRFNYIRFMNIRKFL